MAHKCYGCKCNTCHNRECKTPCTSPTQCELTGPKALCVYYRPYTVASIEALENKARKTDGCTECTVAGDKAGQLKCKFARPASHQDKDRYCMWLTFGWHCQSPSAQKGAK